MSQNLVRNADWYLNAASAAAVDQDLFALGFSQDQQVEQAGQSCATALHDYTEGNTCVPVVIQCGPGNNGADGLVCARHLALWGYSVHIYTAKPPSLPQYQNQTQQAKLSGVDFFYCFETDTHTAVNSLTEILREECVVVDAIFGFSGRATTLHEFQPPYSMMMQAMLTACTSTTGKQKCFCIDTPSGWDVNEGDVKKIGNTPHAIISLTAPKRCIKTLPNTTTQYIGGRFMPPT